MTGMDLALANGRPVAELTDEELRRALAAATGLLDLGPRTPVQTTLAELVDELRHELAGRPGNEARQNREVHDFTCAELDQANLMSDDLRHIGPRYSAPVAMLNFQVALLRERRQRVLTGGAARTEEPALCAWNWP